MSPYLEGVGGASGELRGFTEKDTEPPPKSKYLGTQCGVTLRFIERWASKKRKPRLSLHPLSGYHAAA